ncbi:helix-turn-helix domain-containing protein [Luteimonas abyssi]|uniref:helix-turn-helix domain-containing protein n=1 Tax=Luteimonas abyssi TaxID=1247514 RepID=UPI000737BC19|nr:helix-turn-helix domain-containing protein [Luteimonas abyssi]
MTQATHADFAQRLQTALDASGIAAGRRRTATLAELHGVSRETARKWLSGLALPELERMIELALHHHVSFEWLATGRGEPTREGLSVRDASLKYGDPDEARLLHLIRGLSRKQRRALIDLLDAH